MDDPEPRRRAGWWISPMLAVVVVVSVILTVGQVVDPVPAFLGGFLACLSLGVVGAVINRDGGLRPSRPTLGGVIGLVLWLAAVGAFVWLATAWSDFGSP
jgi:hypothetical protein